MVPCEVLFFACGLGISVKRRAGLKKSASKKRTMKKVCYSLQDMDFQLKEVDLS
jgi:hypothetical protein